MHLRRVTTVFVATLLLIVSSASVAAADCFQTKYPTGSGNLYRGPSPSVGSASWNVSTKALTTSASGYSMASGYCVTAAFDWATTREHFDGRMTRDCDRSSGSRVGSTSDTTTGGRTLLGLQKWGVCYGPNNTNQGCTTSTMSMSGCVITTMRFDMTRQNMTTRWWLRTASGQLDYHDGGSVSSAS